MELNSVCTLNYLIAIAWVLSVAYSLIKLRHMEMDSTARAVWGAIIVFIPFLGVIVFLLALKKQEA